MSWGTWSEFVAMGGYGPYVWGAFIVCVVSVVLEVWLVALRRRNIVHYLRGEP